MVSVLYIKWKVSWNHANGLEALNCWIPASISKIADRTIDCLDRYFVDFGVLQWRAQENVNVACARSRITTATVIVRHESGVTRWPRRWSDCFKPAKKASHSYYKIRQITIALFFRFRFRLVARSLYPNPNRNRFALPFSCESPPTAVYAAKKALLFLSGNLMLMVFMSCKGQLIVARQFSGGIVCITTIYVL